MSHHRPKRRRSRSHSRSPPNKRDAPVNRHQDRSIDYNRHSDSYERHHHHHHHPVQPNRQYDYSHPPVSIDDIISHTEEYSPAIQSLVRELLLEQKKRKLIEERLNLCEHDYALLRTQHEQTVNNLTSLKVDFDRCRLDLKNSSMELNALRHSNSQYRSEIDQMVMNERQRMYNTSETTYRKRHRKH